MATQMKQRARVTREQRAAAARASEHSLRMEGIRLSEQTKADTRQFVSGTLTADEGLARELARHRQG